MKRNWHTSKLIKFKLINIIILNRFLIWINSFWSTFPYLLSNIFWNFSQIISGNQKWFKLTIKISNLWRLKIQLFFCQNRSNIPNQAMLIWIPWRKVGTCSFCIFRWFNQICFYLLFFLNSYIASSWFINTFQNFCIILGLLILILPFLKFMILLYIWLVNIWISYQILAIFINFLLSFSAKIGGYSFSMLKHLSLW